MSSQKAISPIIAIIIILLITIAIAGAGYSYLSAYWTGLTGKQIQVISFFCTEGNQGRVLIKNAGTSSFNTSDITVINARTGQDISRDVLWTDSMEYPSSVLMLRFEEGSGTTAGDSSGKGNDGTLKNRTGAACFTGGACPEWVDGRIGGALEFDGDGDYIDIEDADTLDIPGAITISAWVRLSSVPRNSMMIVSKAQADTSTVSSNLSSADATLYGSGQDDSSGSAAGSGDFNNDGIDDLIIGAPYAERAGETDSTNRGETYIFYGPISPGVFSLSAADATFYGIDPGDASGSAAGSGDFNNDGIDDAIIGAMFAEGAGGSPSSAGETYIIYGPISPGEFSLSTADVTFYGEYMDLSGSAAGSGDFNNDGIDDAIIGAMFAEGAGGSPDMVGETYIFYGPISPGVFNLSAADATFYGIDPGDASGSAAGSGDFNNDGIDDVIIGAETAECSGCGLPSNSAIGETYIFYGPISPGVFNLSAADVTFYGSDFADLSGAAAGSGDFNDDGIDDVIIGATSAEREGESLSLNTGETYIIYGPISPGVFNLSAADATFYGIDMSDISGSAAASGDFNNDGADDVIIGAGYAEGAGGSPDMVGETYIIYGPLHLIENYNLMINENARPIVSFTDSLQRRTSLQAPVNLSLNEFAFVSATIGPDAMSISVDGESASKSITRTLNTNIFNLKIGSFAGTGSYFNGTIDEVSINDWSLNDSIIIEPGDTVIMIHYHTDTLSYRLILGMSTAWANMAC